jgi:CheY-like chemotaxis protein
LELLSIELKELPMATATILVVEDDDSVRMLLQEGLERDGFEVVAASNVSEALKHIATQAFAVLLSDLHMPLAEDGFAVVSATRHTHPRALTMVRSGYPAIEEAMSAIVAQADEILSTTDPNVVNQRSYPRQTGATPCDERSEAGNCRLILEKGKRNHD